MKAAIVKIGNSRGIRIPKAVLDQCGFDQEVEMEIKNHELIIRATSQPRKGWAKAFQTMAKHGDDALLSCVAESAPVWDEEEWEWES